MNQNKTLRKGPTWSRSSGAVLLLLPLVAVTAMLVTSTEGFQESPGTGATTPETGPDASAPAEGETSETGPVVSRQDLISSLTIFVLAVFVGFEVITKVPPTLHTPLMSGSNAISGITLVGALIVTAKPMGWLSPMLGCVAVFLATINAVGGFMVTHRMLAMFRR